jgi:hypothetical protein
MKESAPWNYELGLLHKSVSCSKVTKQQHYCVFRCSLESLLKTNFTCCSKPSETKKWHKFLVFYSFLRSCVFFLSLATMLNLSP